MQTTKILKMSSPLALTSKFRFHEFGPSRCLFSLAFILINSLLLIELSQNAHFPSQRFTLFSSHTILDQGYQFLFLFCLFFGFVGGGGFASLLFSSDL